MSFHNLAANAAAEQAAEKQAEIEEKLNSKSLEELAHCKFQLSDVSANLNWSRN